MGVKEISEIASAASVCEIFLILSNHLSFFNYQILEAIVEDLGNEDEQTLWSEYKNNILKPYLQRSIFEVPSDSTATLASKFSSYYPSLKLIEKN